MTKKYWESCRKEAIDDAKSIIQRAKLYHRCGNYSGKYHAELMETAHMYIDFVRRTNATIKRYY